jgi:hypothetical protein
MSLLASFIPIATDSEGRNVPDAYLYSYDVGTNTPKDTYSDDGLITPNANPLQSDGAGRFFNVYLGAGGYKLVVRDSNDIVIWTQDDYYQALDGSDLANIDADIAAVEQQNARTGAVYTDSGAADAYVLTEAGPGVTPTAYVTNMMITFQPANANTGASTVNVSSLGSRNLYDESGNALAASFLETSAFYTFIYVSSNFRFFSKSGLVDTGYLASGAVTSAKMGTGAAVGNIVDGTLSLAKIEDGTANELMAFDSSGNATSVVNPMRLLASGDLTATTNLDFVLSTLQTAQSVNNAYLIRLVGVQPGTDDRYLNLQVSSDGGSTYVAGTGYRGAATGADDSTAAVNAYSAGLAALIIAGGTTATEGFSNGAGETGFVEITCLNVNTGTSVRPFFHSRCVYNTANTSITARQEGGGTNTSAADYDAIRLVWQSGDWAAVGKYYIYAIPGAI